MPISMFKRKQGLKCTLPRFKKLHIVPPVAHIPLVGNFDYLERKNYFLIFISIH